MSFANAPVTRSLVVGLVGSSMATTLFDAKHYFYILADTHIWRHHQLWRGLTYQLCYLNSSEVLFACMALYQLRVVERMWGSRKFASFVAVTSAFAAVLPPLLVSFLGPLTGGTFNYLPAGPTALIFAILAQYYAIIPHVYHYRVATTSAPTVRTPPAAAGTSPSADDDDDFTGLTFSDKSYRYLLAVQLALFQAPTSLVTAPLGFLFGYAWRSDLLPSALTRWRLPGWLVGGSTAKRSAEFEGMRRRLEDEGGGGAAGSATGVERPGEGGDAHRRNVGGGLLEQFM